MGEDHPDWETPALRLLPRPPDAPSLIGFPATLRLLIGRETEIQAVLDLLRQPTCRLLTLTGPGGIGKTRLALAATAEVAGDYADGAVYVPLEALRDPASVIPAIALALGVRDAPGRSLREIVSHALRDREQLLVLDNFEHVVGAAADVAFLLEASPGLTVLVTSRVPLRVQAEQRSPTPPLTVPSTSQAAPEALLAHDAIALFVERARRVQPDFQLTEDNAAAVVALAQHLEGIPLAIELAAAWSHVLSPHALLSRLTRRLEVLTGGPTDQPPRLQSMREAIAWSYALLAEDEQQLFRSLGVFVGGFRLEAAEAVGTLPSSDPLAASNQGASQVLPLLARLVDASLVQRVGTEGQEPRYQLLETVREFALEQVRAHGESEHVVHRHAQWMQGLVERTEPHLLGPMEIEHQDAIRIELDNLRAALAWSTVHAPQIAVRMGGLLWVFWIYQSLIAEGFAWITSSLATGADTSLERANAMVTAAALAMMQADTDHAAPLLTEAAAVSAPLDDPVLSARRWFIQGAVDLQFGQTTDAVQAFGYAVVAYDAATSTTDRTMQAWNHASQGLSIAATGNHSAALTLYEQAQQAAAQAGSRFVESLILCDYAALLLDLGDLRGARQQMTDVLRMAIELDHHGQTWQHWPASQALLVLAAIDAHEHAAQRSAQRFGAAEAMMNRLGLILTPSGRSRSAQTLQLLERDLGIDAARTLRAQGKADPTAVIDDSVRRHTPAPDNAPTRAVADQTGLSARERQILLLIASGQSDRQIAEALFISRKTASNHVANILHKLEVPTRAAAVARAVSEQLIPTIPTTDAFPAG